MLIITTTPSTSTQRHTSWRQAAIPPTNRAKQKQYLEEAQQVFSLMFVKICVFPVDSLFDCSSCRQPVLPEDYSLLESAAFRSFALLVAPAAAPRAAPCAARHTCARAVLRSA